MTTECRWSKLCSFDGKIHRKKGRAACPGSQSWGVGLGVQTSSIWLRVLGHHSQLPYLKRDCTAWGSSAAPWGSNFPGNVLQALLLCTHQDANRKQIAHTIWRNFNEETTADPHDSKILYLWIHLTHSSLFETPNTVALPRSFESVHRAVEDFCVQTTQSQKVQQGKALPSCFRSHP